MSDFFVAGGFGMYPTLLAGLALLASCLQYARQPERRYVPLMLTLGIFTVLAGSLGFVSGVRASLMGYFASSESDRNPIYIAAGVAESLSPFMLALALCVFSTICAAVGAWRLSRRLEPAAAR